MLLHVGLPGHKQCGSGTASLLIETEAKGLTGRWCIQCGYTGQREDSVLGGVERSSE